MGNPVSPEPPKAPAMKYCISCGQQMLTDSKFCAHCGGQQSPPLGATLSKPHLRKKGNDWILGATVIALILVYFFLVEIVALSNGQAIGTIAVLGVVIGLIKLWPEITGRK